jgi:hypothetical protein
MSRSAIKGEIFYFYFHAIDKNVMSITTINRELERTSTIA